MKMNKKLLSVRLSIINKVKQKKGGLECAEQVSNKYGKAD